MKKCIFGINEAFCIVKPTKDVRGSELKLYKAVNELLSIDVSLNDFRTTYLNKLGGLVRWISKYCCNEYFLLDNISEELIVKDWWLKEFQGLYNSLQFFQSWEEFQTVFKRKLKRKKIDYIDSSIDDLEGKFIFPTLYLLQHAEMLKTVYELYLFTHGEQLEVTPLAVNGKPLLPLNIMASCESFYPLNRYDLDLQRSFFLLEVFLEDAALINDAGSHFQIITDVCGKNDFEELYNQKFGNDAYSLHPFPITKDMPLGDIYFKLAKTIICAYLDTYSSYDACLRRVYSTHELSETTGRFKKKPPATLKAQNPIQLKGFIKIHNAMANAILNEDFYKCEFCGRFFLSTRGKAKTCSPTCRNKLSATNKAKKRGPNSIVSTPRGRLA